MPSSITTRQGVGGILNLKLKLKTQTPRNLPKLRGFCLAIF